LEEPLAKEDRHGSQQSSHPRWNNPVSRVLT
jgi:hypothetical protein